jgi:cation diffusion facilitator family transporter
VAAGWIILEAVHKFYHPEEMRYLYLGITVMAFSALVNTLVSRQLYKVAKETDSIALEADALHLKTDVYTSVGVAAGIGVIWVTGLHFLDPVIAIAVALLIVYESVILIRNAYRPLVDTALPPEDLKKIHGILNKYTGNHFHYHQFRTRKSGSHKYLDFHLEVPAGMKVEEAHDLCDTIEADLKKLFNNLDINIHIEPRKEDDQAGL